MYLTTLKDHLRKILTEQNLNSYDEIFYQSEGASPTIVYELLKNETYFSSNHKIITKAVIGDSFLPEPNPVNYDWRFDKDTLSYLMNLVKISGCKRIALFGVPSLFLLLKNLDLEVYLFDINETLERYFKSDRVWIGDLNTLNVKNYELFDCVIMDPPWYLQYYETWLAKANKIIRPDGLIMSTLFEYLLRPNAKKELSRITHIAEDYGSYQIHKKAVVYETPRFEKEMFLSLDIPCFENWRTADLLQITKKKEHTTPINIPNEVPWVRLIFDGQLIAIKSEHYQKQLTVKYPYPGNNAEIRSVSNRDRIRKRLNLITSRNKGLIITGGDKLIEIISQLNLGQNLTGIIEKLMLSKKESEALIQILNLIHNNYE
jgi:hypothetical protein